MSPLIGQARSLGAVKLGLAVADFDPATLSTARGWYESDRIGSFSSGNPLSSWVDDTSYENNATQTGTARPNMLTVGGLPTVTFDGVNDSLVIPSGLSQNNQVTTVFVVVYPTVIYDAVNIIQPFVELSTTYAGALVAYSGQIINQNVDGASDRPTGLFLEPNYVGHNVISPSVIMLQMTAANTLIRANGADSTVAAITSRAITGGLIGSSNNASFYLKGSMYAVGIFENMSEANRDAVYTHLVSKYRYSYSPTQNLIVALGNSQTNGLAATLQTNAYPSKLIDLLDADGKSYQLYNDGITGASTAAVTARFPTYAIPKYSASRSKNIATIASVSWIDLVGSATGASIYSTLSSGIASLKAAGFTVYVSTQAPGVTLTAPQEAERVSLNNLIIANSAAADYVVNLTAISQLEDESNPTYYGFSDHWTDAALALVGQAFHDAGGF